MFNFAVKLTFDNHSQSWDVSCRDLPLLHSVGNTIEEALLEAQDGIIAAI